jgi:segregation and condensation protein A
MPEPYSIKLPVFEGPMDLLLHLIKENKLDIYDIPISLITGQYLEYIELMKELNLEIAGEFLVMAATLIQIKSRMLLPPDEAAPEEEPVDPRLELVSRLIEYQAMKQASLALKEMGEAWAGVLSRAFEEEGEVGEEGEEELSLFDISLFDLIGAFRKILDKAPPELVSISKESLTVKDRIARILEVLEAKETVTFEELFDGESSRSVLIVTFVALLELLKLGLARAYQEKGFGEIWVLKPQLEEKQDGQAEVSQANIPVVEIQNEPEEFSPDTLEDSESPNP